MTTQTYQAPPRLVANPDHATTLARQFVSPGAGEVLDFRPAEQLVWKVMADASGGVFDSFEAGKRLADFYAALKAGPLPGWAHEVGGPNTPVPNGETRATLDLARGHYLITCYIPSPDGVPHFAKGMTSTAKRTRSRRLEFTRGLRGR